MTTAPIRPRPQLYLCVFGAWAVVLAWFHPRLVGLLSVSDGAAEYAALLFFVVFTEISWLYGLYNIGIVIFAGLYRRRATRACHPECMPDPNVAVAVLYTTCNDFIEESAESCVQQCYPSFKVYLLDDSTDPEFQARVDAFAARWPGRAVVVRRPTRAGFKAGNINNALRGPASAEPVFALVDADEILPRDFLRRLVPRLLADPSCGFIQANHRSSVARPGSVGEALGIGVDVHWRWYHPLRNDYGFVMLLGHGAVLRRTAFDAIGGFPEIVSEDLAFALRIRELGWRGRFAEDVVCFESFPTSVRAFRIRHMKWTRGTCELLSREMGAVLRSARFTLVEKLDILFPVVSLPLALVFFLFLVDANLVIPAMFAESRTMTLSLGGGDLNIPFWGLDPRFGAVLTPDFYVITLATFVAPILCFVVDLVRTPLTLLRFLCRSTTLYASIGPMSCLGVISWLVTRRADFLVTGDAGSRGLDVHRGARGVRILAHWKRVFATTHPDEPAVQAFEILCGVLLAWACVLLLQVSSLGLAMAFVLLPVMHRVTFEHSVVRRLTYVPFGLIISGLGIGGVSACGIQTIFFGYGFHF